MRRWLNHPDGCARPGELGIGHPASGGGYPYGRPMEPWPLDHPSLPGSELPRTELQQPNAFIDSLPAYDQSEQSEMNLEWSRLMNEAERYIYRGVAFPPLGVPGLFTGFPNGIVFNNGETKRGSFSVPPYSFLLSISVHMEWIFGGNDGGPGDGAPACWFSLMDKGSVYNLFGGEFALSFTQAGEKNPLTQIPDEPTGPFYLWSPLSIAPPGEMEWAITNTGMELSGGLWLQMGLQFAVPLTAENVGVPSDKSATEAVRLPRRGISPGGF